MINKQAKLAICGLKGILAILLQKIVNYCETIDTAVHM